MTDAADTSRALALVGAHIAQQRIHAGYFRSGQRILHGWNPIARRMDDDVRAAGVTALSRAIESLQNSGWLAGAIEVVVGQIVGEGLQLAANPDGESLGWDDKTRAEWARLVEKRWKTWSTHAVECDVAGRQTVGQMTANQMKIWFAHGEHLATLEAVERPGATTRTKVQVLDPLSLPRETWRFKSNQGVVTDKYGFPVEYIFRMREADTLIEHYQTVPARGRNGRPLVLHVFDGLPGQRRGMTPLTPALRRVRQYDQLSDATLTAALIQTIFAASVKSTLPPEEVFSALKSISDNEPVASTMISAYGEQVGEWYKKAQIDLGDDGRFVHLFPNEELNFHRSETPNATYEPFSKTMLREIARCIPCTYETLTGDYNSATYSSVRIGTSEHWPVILYRRRHIAAPFVQGIYEAWLEEQILTGQIPFPGGPEAFGVHRAAVFRATWRGPARPTADDQKTAQASATKIANRLSTLEAECAEQGLDWEEVLIQQGREMAMMDLLGLPAVVDAKGTKHMGEAESMAEDKPVKGGSDGRNAT